MGFLRMCAYPRTNLCVWAQVLAKSFDQSGPKMMEEVCDPMNLLFSRGTLIPSSKPIIHSLLPKELPVNLYFHLPIGPWSTFLPFALLVWLVVPSLWEPRFTHWPLVLGAAMLSKCTKKNQV